MKQVKFLLGACLALSVAGCSDEVGLTTGRLPVSGNEIVFGVGAGEFTPPHGKRTVYGIPEGETVDDYTKLTVDWLPGEDQVRVYCPEASAECRSADYTVLKKTSGSDAADSYYLSKNGEVGVRWGDDLTRDYHFYAFYPLHVTQATTISGLTDDLTVAAAIPTDQEHGVIEKHEEDGSTWYEVKPDMRYAMMVGNGTWTPNAEQNVSLRFTPIVTVLDVSVTASAITQYKITDVIVRSKTQPIVGHFTYDFSKAEGERFSFPSVEEDTKVASVSCRSASGEAIPLKPGERLNVKFFLLPRNIEASELSVSVVLENGMQVTRNLVEEGSEADPVLMQGKIIKIRTPQLNPVVNNWMSLLDDDILFASQLSIPGTKFSYTWTKYEEESRSYNANNGLMNAYQKLSIRDQFNTGIRAFDIRVRAANSNGNATPYIYVSGTDLVLNGAKVKLTDMLDTLSTELDKSPTEFVVLSINYVDDGTAAPTWLTNICKAIDTWSASHRPSQPNGTDADYFREVTSTTTVGAMRGGIGVMIHYPQSKEGISLSLDNVNVIWQYSNTVQNMDISDLDMSSGRGNATLHLQNLQQHNSPEGDHGLGIYPYYITQKFAQGRVDSKDLIARKKQLIEDLFDLSSYNNAQSGTDRTNNIYLNDLGGFCVVNNPESTGYAEAQKYVKKDGSWVKEGGSKVKLTDYGAQPLYDSEDKLPAASDPDSPSECYVVTADRSPRGQGGNNALLAEQINPDAVQTIYNLVNDSRTPLGVVYMNFAGTNEVTFGGTTYNVCGLVLPSIIVSNNFKFPLATASMQPGN